MQERYPQDEDGEEAREGTAAHWTALDCMGHPPAIGTLAPNGYPVDRAMLEGAEMLADDVAATRAAASPSARLRVEQRVWAHRTIHPDNDGTPDAYLIDRERRVVHGWDYKYGHKYVPVQRNWQFVDYLAGIFETHKGLMDELDDWTATFTVVQPRCYHSDGPVREWHVTGAELRSLWTQLRTAALAASMPDATCRTGPHCYKCAAAFDCVAHLQSGQTAVEMTGTQQPLDMAPPALALWKQQIDQAAARLKSISDAVDERILGQLRRGERVPGYGIGSTQPLERWRNPAAAAVMGDMFGIDLRKPEPTLVTPKQARKMGVDSAVITEYAETPPGAQKLVKTDSDAALAVFGTR
jgi:hypothetical protein